MHFHSTNRKPVACSWDPPLYMESRMNYGRSSRADEDAKTLIKSREPARRRHVKSNYSDMATSFMANGCCLVGSLRMEK